MTKNNMSPKTHDLVVTCVFSAPIELVWKAWTDPDYVMRWWGPDHLINTVTPLAVGYMTVGLITVALMYSGRVNTEPAIVINAAGSKGNIGN